MLWLSGKRTCNQRLQSQRMRYKSIDQKAQPVGTLGNPNGRGRSLSQCERCINEPNNEVTSFLQIVPLSNQSGRNRLNTYAFLDSGSTVSFIYQSLQEKMEAQGTDVTLSIAGIQ